LEPLELVLGAGVGVLASAPELVLPGVVAPPWLLVFVTVKEASAELVIVLRLVPRSVAVE
jgi:hypothetical protein